MFTLVVFQNIHIHYQSSLAHPSICTQVYIPISISTHPLAQTFPTTNPLLSCQQQRAARSGSVLLQPNFKRARSLHPSMVEAHTHSVFAARRRRRQSYTERGTTRSSNASAAAAARNDVVVRDVVLIIANSVLWMCVRRPRVRVE